MGGRCLAYHSWWEVAFEREEDDNGHNRVDDGKYTNYNQVFECRAHIVVSSVEISEVEPLTAPS